MTFVSFPGVPFPKNFTSVAKTILKRLFRVYAHIYHQHFDSVMQLQEEAHLNTSFKHFIFFVQVMGLDWGIYNSHTCFEIILWKKSFSWKCVDKNCIGIKKKNIYIKILPFFYVNAYGQEFNLIDRRELVPLQELIEKLGTKDR